MLNCKLKGNILQLNELEKGTKQLCLLKRSVLRAVLLGLTLSSPLTEWVCCLFATMRFLYGEKSRRENRNK